MAMYPSLHALNQRALHADATSLRDRVEQYIRPWQIVIQEKVELHNRITAHHHVCITVSDGPVDLQDQMLKALTPLFDAAFDAPFYPAKNSGKKFTTCSDKSKSTLEWEYKAPLEGAAPLYGVPAASRLPGGDPETFLRRAFGATLAQAEPVVQLGEELYKWRSTPGMTPSISRTSFVLERQAFGAYPSQR